MTSMDMRRVGILFALYVGGLGLVGCSNVVDSNDVPVGETSQELSRCGANNTCGAGWTCVDKLDGGCHPVCTFPVSLTPTSSGAGLAGVCPAPFSGWQCCLGYTRSDG